eukprot:12961526-Ditylum_brightwellii.AAC.1
MGRNPTAIMFGGTTTRMTVPWEIRVFHNAVSLILVDEYSFRSRDSCKRSYPATDSYSSTSIYSTAL